MTSILLSPGSVPLAHWRAIYRGASATLPAEAYEAIETSAQAVAAIVTRRQPVYAINTGCGKLANVRIEAADLTTLQRDISSTTPSAKYSCSGSPLMLVNGSTAIEGAGARRAPAHSPMRCHHGRDARQRPRKQRSQSAQAKPGPWRPTASVST